MYTIGIDIGGMSAKLGLLQDHQIVQESVIKTGAEMGYGTFLLLLKKEINALLEQTPLRQVQQIGISSCGLIDSKKGSIVYANNLPWKDRNMAGDLSEVFGVPVKIANDAKCAALAEAVCGAGKEYERVCMITLGTGVGGAFLCGGTLSMRNPYGDADGILGHIGVESGGRLCTCGRRGCLEAYASATAVMKRYEEWSGERCSAKEIFDRARAKEELAGKVIQEFKYYLGEGLTSLVNVLRPEVIVIGGGMAAGADLFLKELNQTVNEQAFGGSILPVHIVPAALGNKAGIIGASLL